MKTLKIIFSGIFTLVIFALLMVSCEQKDVLPPQLEETATQLEQTDANLHTETVYGCTTEENPNALIETEIDFRESISLDEIMNCTDAEFKLAFHFKANSSGQNFTCGSSSTTLLKARTFANRVVREMNDRMATALLHNGQNKDAKIRFSLVNSGDCSGIYLYNNNESFQNLPNAINVRFKDGSGSTIRGYTTYGANWIVIENVLENILAGYNKTWDIGRILNHEFGHTRSLKHTFNCSNPCLGDDIVLDDECCGRSCVSGDGPSPCWNCSTRALMMSHGTQLRMTECETERMWNYIINNSRSYQQVNRCNSGCSLTGQWVSGGSGNLGTVNHLSGGSAEVRAICSGADKFTWTKTSGNVGYSYCRNSNCSKLFIYMSPGQSASFLVKSFKNNVELDRRTFTFVRN